MRSAEPQCVSVGAHVVETRITDVLAEWVVSAAPVKMRRMSEMLYVRLLARVHPVSWNADLPVYEINSLSIWTVPKPGQYVGSSEMFTDVEPMSSFWERDDDATVASFTISYRTGMLPVRIYASSFTLFCLYRWAYTQFPSPPRIMKSTKPAPYHVYWSPIICIFVRSALKPLGPLPSMVSRLNWD